MKVHHLNCGTMRMPGAPLVCHVLLLETDRWLVLVDAGYGLGDIADPAHRIGPYRAVIRPALVPEQTAIRQVQARGFDPRDVRHVVLTHGDVDHAGGIGDFPWATVHLTASEADAVRRRPTWFERQRYSTRQWAHHPTITEHSPGDQTWRGIGGAAPLDDVADGLLLLPLPGHSRGHAAVAVDTGQRWLLHAGDAFYHHGTLDGSTPVPAALRVQERAFAYDANLVRHNHQLLSGLYLAGDPGLELVNAHDPHLLEHARQAADQRA